MSNKSNDELKPCNKCKELPLVLNFQVICTSCDTSYETIEEWNRRTESEKGTKCQ